MTPGHILALRCPARAESLKLLRDSVRTACQDLNSSNRFAENIVIAVNEACMNIIEHAYRGTTDGEIMLEIINNDSSLLFRITDFADPVDVSTIRPRELDEIRPGGLGTHFINEVMDEVEYTVLPDRSGNRLEMRKRLPQMGETE